MYRYIIIFFLSICGVSKAIAQQFQLHGIVYNYFDKKPVNAVTVYTSSGTTTFSDSLGRYAIKVKNTDSIWFSYLNKNSIKYPVDTITDPLHFEIALYIDAAWLPTVTVYNKNYRLDSLNNRRNYAKIFNFKKPGLELSTIPPSAYAPGGVAVGLDLDALINMFKFRKNRAMEKFQQRLLQQEQDKYIDHRFTKLFVRKLTHLEGNELSIFMIYYRPNYNALLQMNDLEFGYYIQQSYKQYLYLKK